MTYNWKWDILFEQSPEAYLTYLDLLISGLGWTVATGICAWVLALVLGSVVGIMRTLPSHTAALLGNAYVELFRNVPLLVQLFLWYFVLPEVLPQTWGDWLKQLRHAPFYTAVIGIGLFMSARVAEQVLAGINALAKGQRRAALAIGLTLSQAYRYVLMPMAYRLILPTLTSEALNTMKNTSVALTIGLLELTARARAMQEYSFQPFESFAVATLFYLMLNLSIVVAMRGLERWVALPGYGVSAR